MKAAVQARLGRKWEVQRPAASDQLGVGLRGGGRLLLRAYRKDEDERQVVGHDAEPEQVPAAAR